MTRACSPVVAIALVFACLVAPAAAQDEVANAFTIERLNAGLGPPPEALDRSTPRATLEALVRLTDGEPSEEAAHLLDLAPVPPDAQAARGPVLAERLAYVIDRKIALAWDAIPDRPDGMETQGSSRDPMVGETRRSIAIGTLEADDWPVTIRLNRV